MRDLMPQVEERLATELREAGTPDGDDADTERRAGPQGDAATVAAFGIERDEAKVQFLDGESRERVGDAEALA